MSVYSDNYNGVPGRSTTFTASMGQLKHFINIVNVFFQKFGKAVAGKYLGTNITPADEDAIRLKDTLDKENKTIDYNRQRKLIEDYGPKWQLEQEAEGYDAIGLNRMGLAGSTAAGVSASTPETPSAGLAGSSSVDILGLLMNSVLRSKELDIAQQRADTESVVGQSVANKNASETSGIDIRNANLQELYDLQKGETSKRIEFMGQQIETEPVRRALLKTEISLNQAKTAVENNMSALQQIDLKYHDAYQAAQANIARAYAGILATNNKYQERLLQQQIDINAKQIEIMQQTIITGKLSAGMLAKDFQYYDSDRKFNRWMTGVGTGAKVLGAIGGVALGAGRMMSSVGQIAKQSYGMFPIDTYSNFTYGQ